MFPHPGGELSYGVPHPRFASLLQPQNPYHRAFFNWNAWLAFNGGQMSCFGPGPRPPTPLPNPPLQLLPPTPKAKKKKTTTAAFSVDSLLHSATARANPIPSPTSTLAMQICEGPLSVSLCLKPIDVDEFLSLDKTEQSEEDADATMELRVQLADRTFGGLFTRISASLNEDALLSLSSGREVRVGKVWAETNVRGCEDGRWRAARPIGGGEELVLFVAPPQSRDSLPHSDTTASPTSPASKASKEDSEKEEGRPDFPPIEEYEGEPASTPNGAGFGCQRCGKVFSYRYYRDKHLKYTRCVDLGDRKFPCELCPRSFEKRDRLRIHVLHVHEKHRPHACSVCGKRFSQSSSLNKHLRVHSGERPYKCLHCPKAFTASSILRTHVRQHSGEKPFQCRHCGKAFASHAAHDSHVRRTHQSPKNEAHPCLWCEKSFEHSSHLKFHLQCAHAEATTPTRPPDLK